MIKGMLTIATASYFWHPRLSLEYDKAVDRV